MVKELSYLDPGTVLKDVHDENGHALRIRDANSRVPSEYSKVIFERDIITNSITVAKFYRGSQAEKTRIKFFGDVAGSLSGKYFLINTAEDATEYYVWYNDGFGVDPAIPNKVGVEIPYVQNDPASLIRQATYLYFFKNCEHFDTQVNGDDVLIVENAINGETTNSSDVDTGFAITTIHEGITLRICTLEIPQDVGIKYIYNHAERRFELETSLSLTGAVTVTGITVSAGQIANISAPVAGTEYSFTLAAGVGSFEMNARGNAKVQWSFITGQTNTVFKTLFPGSNYEKSGLNLTTPMTIYFETNKTGEVLEVITYS